MTQIQGSLRNLWWTVFLLVFIGSFTWTQAQVVTPFNASYSTNTAGDITLIGNALQTCVGNAKACTDAQQGITIANNNDFTMTYIDVDADPTTFNSSRAALNLPVGAEVLFAGLYWGADLSANTGGQAAVSAVNNKDVKFQVPGSLTYLTLSPTQLGNPYRCGEIGRSLNNYAGFCDVTALVRAAGNGGYTVANVQSGTGVNRYAGWTMAIVYKYAGEPSRNLTVFQGYAIVSGTAVVNIPVTGFRAPPAGTVNAKIGAVGFEGDLGITGDSLKLNGQTLTDVLNPATNFFNSNFTLQGIPYVARTPNYANLMAVDASTIATTGLIANNATSATITASTGGDTYFPLVVTTAIEIYAPKINALKTATDLNGGLLQANDVIEYNIALSNTGQDNASNVVLTDAIPANTTFVAGSLKINGANAGALADFDNINNLVRFYLGTGASAGVGGTLSINGSASISFQVQVNSNVADEAVISNVAGTTFNAATTGTALSAGSNEVRQAVSRPILVLSKTSSTNPVQVGGVLTYTLSYRNDGTATAMNAQIVDMLPAEVTHLSNSFGAIPVGQNLTLPLGNLPPGASGAVNVIVRVNAGVANATGIVNQASFSADGSVTVNTSQRTVAISEPYLTLTKTASATVVGVGNKLVYTLSYANAGTSDALNVTLVDNLPANTTFSSASAGGIPSGSVVTWTIGTVPAGVSGSVTVIVTVDAGAVGSTLTNNATITGSNTNTATSSTDTPVVTQPVLSINKKAASTRVLPGELLTYTIEFANIGSGAARNVVLYDPLLANQTFVSSSGSGQYDATSNTVTWVLGTLASQQSGSVTLTVRLANGLADGTFIRNKTTLTSIDASSVTSETQLVVYTQPVLSLKKTASQTVVASGDTLTFTLTYANTGSGDAINAFLDDPLPDNVSFVSASGNHSVLSDSVHWTIGRIAAGTSGSVTLTVLVDNPLPNGTQLVNAATLNTPDPIVQPASALSITPVSSAPQLVLEKKALEPIVAAGERQTYILSYRNVGTDTAINTVLTEAVPVGTTFVSATAGGVEAGGIVTWNIGALQANDGGSVTMTVALNMLPNGTKVENIASVVADNAPAADASATTLVSAEPRLVINKVADKTIVAAGGVLQYSISIKNIGNAVATGVKILDDLPDDIVGVPITTPVGDYDAIAKQVTWQIGSVDVNQEVTVVVTVNILAPLANGTLLGNAASVFSDQQPVQGTQIATPVTSAPSLQVSKVADHNPVLANSLLTYTITYSNVGTDAATDVMLEESVPAHATFSSATGSYTQTGNQIKWDIGTLAAGATGSVSLTVMVDNGVANGSLLVNTVNLAASNAGSASDTLQTVVSSRPVLSIDKDTIPAGITSVTAGETVTYQINYQNSGTDAALNLEIIDILPKGMSLVSSSLPPFSDNVLPSGARELKWNTASFAAGSTGSITLVAAVDNPIANGQILNNRVSINADNAQPMVDVVSIISQSRAVLTLTKTASTAVLALDGTNPIANQVSYTITYSNTGTDTAENVVLTDYLPLGVAHVSHTGAGVYDAATHQITWTVGAVAVGASATETIVVEVPVPFLNNTVLQNSASVTGEDNKAAALVPATANVDVTVNSSPNILITKQALNSSTAIGAQNTFTISVTNQADATETARSWMVTDILPAGLQFISANSGFYDAATRTFTVSGGGIAPAQTQIITLVVEVVAPAVAGNTISNTAAFTASNATGNATGSFVVTGDAAFNISKTASVNTVSLVPNQAIVYNIAYSNNGTSSASNVNIVDTLPTGVTFISATPAPSSQMGSVLTWNMASLAVGGSGVIQVNTQTQAGLIDNQILTNQVTISDGTHMAQANAVVTALFVPPNVTLVKAIRSGAIFQVGQLVNYDINYTVGASPMTNFMISDTLPVMVDFVSASAGGSYDPGLHTVSWPIGTVTNVSGVVSVTVRIKAQAQPGTIVQNGARSNFDPLLISSTHGTILQRSATTGVPVSVPWFIVIGLACLGAYIGRKQTRR